MFLDEKCKKTHKKTHFWYKDVSDLRFYSLFKIWTTIAQGTLLSNVIFKTEKKSKATLFLNEKIQKNHTGYMGASNLRFYSIFLL
jgi:hypothetical protein